MFRDIYTLPEIKFTVSMVFIMVLLSVIYGLPISLPTGGNAAFVGIHYLYPLVGVIIWGVFSIFGQKSKSSKILFIALPCYAIILLVHFNIKLWVPMINPTTWDKDLWILDKNFHFLIDGLFFLHRKLELIFPINGNLYMIGFMAMFYISFCYHVIQSTENFRKLFLAALFFQGLGALSYIPFPALGPFLFEPGISDRIAEGQAGMYNVHQDIVSQGAQWLSLNAPVYLTAGLGAMPSLHAGGSFLFFLFAVKYGRVLVPLYSILLGYILMAAVTTRWHYLVDLPVGMGLAWFSIWLAEKASQPKSIEEAGVQDAIPHASLA